MKKILLILLCVLTINTIAQNSFHRYTTTNEKFYNNIDSLWVEQDTTGSFVRVLDISDASDVIKLSMSNNSYTEKYTYYIDKVQIIDKTSIYFCRDIELYPIIIEVKENSIALYYYYTQSTAMFGKAELLNIHTKKQIFVD